MERIYASKLKKDKKGKNRFWIYVSLYLKVQNDMSHIIFYLAFTVNLNRSKKLAYFNSISIIGYI